jgi:hypothetical protein
MKTSTSTGAFIPLNRYTILFLIALSVPLFALMDTFFKDLGVAEDEALTTGFIIMVIVAIFAGRYIGRLVALKMNEYPKRMLVVLCLICGSLIFWLFFYGQFPLRDRPVIGMFFFGLPLLIASFILGLIIKVVRDVATKQLNAAKSSAAHSESELQLLQSQISPHFLFNTLNNMYGLSITQHEKIPSLLLKLSDLLRYSVYEANKSFVPVKDELAYIMNYIDFEKMRIGDRLALTTDIEDFQQSDAKIAPMMLIVFIENAFKHSKNTTNDKIFIHISIKTWGNRILFSVVNSYDPNDRSTGVAGGFGLDNVKKRLELLYAGEYHLVQEDSDNTYKVMLQLKIK